MDDTDSREGGCTTFLARRLVAAFPELRPRGFARLVRLNPNVPWKTRGNAAVGVAFEGEFPLDEAERRVARVVGAHARVGAEGTDPGWAVSRVALARSVYVRAVREVVPLADAVAALDAAGARYGGLKSGRGLIGAAAALAWEPGEGDRTFELIAYRSRERWGSSRVVEGESVREMQRAFPSTFDSFDVVNGEVVMVPSSPCPVLWGIRGEVAEDLPGAAALVRGEAPAESTLFVTNQGTDDHLQDLSCGALRPFVSARLRVEVAGAAVERGGHVFVPARDASGEVTLAFYAPTRQLRAVGRALAPGDRALVAGGVHANPSGGFTLGVEKLCVEGVARLRRKLGNPRCAACGKAMKSAGAGAGYRCRVCGSRAPPEAAAFGDVARGLSPGWFEAPACARRHLAMPLSRLLDREAEAEREQVVGVRAR